MEAIFLFIVFWLYFLCSYLENIKKEVDNNNIDVILNVKNFSKTMYYKMIGTSIMKILKAEYSEVLENINKNDK